MSIGIHLGALETPAGKGNENFYEISNFINLFKKRRKKR
jgi:hypothetical protein